MKQSEEILNRVAQGLTSRGDALAWFRNQEPDARQKTLRSLQNFALQAGATANDIAQSIADSQLKLTYTPCVLLQTKELREALAKIVMLPSEEQDKSFALLLSLFAVADHRRRNVQCENGCSHEWHNLTR